MLNDVFFFFNENIGCFFLLFRFENKGLFFVFIFFLVFFDSWGKSFFCIFWNEFVLVLFFLMFGNLFVRGVIVFDVIVFGFFFGCINILYLLG